MNLYSHNQVITEFLFILNTADYCICNGWLLHSWPLLAWFEYVCMCKCSHVCCGFLIVSVFAKVFPNARGWTFPSERWKQLGSKGWYDGPQDGGVGLGDGCLMFICVHESDLLGFMKIYVVLLSLSIRYVEMSWDILYIWELGGLCCVVGWNFQVLFQDLVKFIFHERTWVCFWSCLETKT